MTRNADLIHPYFVPEQKLPDFFIIEVHIGESKRGEIRESFAYQEEYMDRQILQPFTHKNDVPPRKLVDGNSPSENRKLRPRNLS